MPLVSPEYIKSLLSPVNAGQNKASLSSLMKQPEESTPQIIPQKQEIPPSARFEIETLMKQGRPKEEIAQAMSSLIDDIFGGVQAFARGASEAPPIKIASDIAAGLGQSGKKLYEDIERTARKPISPETIKETAEEVTRPIRGIAAAPLRVLGVPIVSLVEQIRGKPLRVDFPLGLGKVESIQEQLRRTTERYGGLTGAFVTSLGYAGDALITKGLAKNLATSPRNIQNFATDYISEKAKQTSPNELYKGHFDVQDEVTNVTEYLEKSLKRKLRPNETKAIQQVKQSVINETVYEFSAMQKKVPLGNIKTINESSIKYPSLMKSEAAQRAGQSLDTFVDDALKEGIIQFKDVSEASRELVSYIQKNGIRSVPPILVKPLQGGKYEIIDGVHRFDAFKELGIRDIPVFTEKLDRVAPFTPSAGIDVGISTKLQPLGEEALRQKAWNEKLLKPQLISPQKQQVEAPSAKLNETIKASPFVQRFLQEKSTGTETKKSPFSFSRIMDFLKPKVALAAEMQTDNVPSEDTGDDWPMARGYSPETLARLPPITRNAYLNQVRESGGRNDPVFGALTKYPLNTFPRDKVKVQQKLGELYNGFRIMATADAFKDMMAGVQYDKNTEYDKLLTNAAVRMTGIANPYQFNQEVPEFLHYLNDSLVPEPVRKKVVSHMKTVIDLYLNQIINLNKADAQLPGAKALNDVVNIAIAFPQFAHLLDTIKPNMTTKEMIDEAIIIKQKIKDIIVRPPNVIEGPYKLNEIRHLQKKLVDLQNSPLWQ